MSDREIVLMGYSGHGIVVADAAIASKKKLLYYMDKTTAVKNPYELYYLGFELELDDSFWQKEYGYILGIGDNYIRRKTADHLISKQVELLNVTHPSASISVNIQMGIGNFISRNVSVNALVEIGNFCILNTGCVIEHECILGNGTHIAPGAVLAGNVEIGENSFIGANSVVKQGVKIGANVIVGAGSVILHNIDDNSKIVGNPGRII